ESQTRRQRLMKLTLRVLVDGLAVSLVVTLSLRLITGEPLVPELVTLFFEIWVYTILIAAPAHAILPRLYPLVVQWAPAVRWAVLAFALAAIAVAGSLVGSLVVLGLRLEP